MKKSPPILGGVEARKGFGGGKSRVQTQDEREIATVDHPLKA